MTQKWIDYSYARPDLDEAKAAGAVGVLRYICQDQPATHGKIIDRAERDQILHRGLDLVLNYEWYATRALEGYGAGLTDGRVAHAAALGLAYPEGAAVQFSVDTDTHDYAAVDGYFDGVRAGLAGRYKVGGYGSHDVVAHLLGTRRADVGWQACAWSYGQRDPAAVIYQDGSSWFHGNADEDLVTGNVWGWLEAEKHAPAQPQPSKPPASKPGVPTGPGPKPKPGRRLVVVHAGDTLTSIAAAHDTTVAHLAALNHIADVNVIHVGEVLQIDASTATEPPVAAGRSVIVRLGDTLTSIAARVGVSWQTLARINHLADPNRIREGQRLHI